jgi:hypothetical protein
VGAASVGIREVKVMARNTERARLERIFIREVGVSSSYRCDMLDTETS